MGCGCSNSYSSSCCSVPTNCSEVCGSIILTNSWNIPACGGSAVVVASGSKNILLGSYLYSPTYGYYKMVSFNALTGEILITNECQGANAAPGTIVPAYQLFAIGVPPSDIGWTSFSPTATPAGAMTLSGTAFTQAQYTMNSVSKTVLLNVVFTATVAGTPTGFIDFTLPHNIAGPGADYFVGAGTYTSASSTNVGAAVFRKGSSSTEISVYLLGGGNYAAGALTLKFQGTYIGA